MVTPEKKRKYKKHFIKEAIFEAKFTNDDDSFESTTLGQIFEQIKKIYPQKRDIKHIPIYLDRPETTPPKPLTIQAPLFQALKEDHSELLQIGPGIAVANQLVYSTWENFIPAIQTLLNAYITITNPKMVTRIGTRYINRFILPSENITLTDYFNIGVQIPKTLSNFQGFDITFINKINDNSSDLAPLFDVKTKFLSDALKNDEIGNAIILDIDCFIHLNEIPDTTHITTVATQAHNTLEKVFEAIITDKIRLLMEIEQ